MSSFDQEQMIGLDWGLEECPSKERCPGEGFGRRSGRWLPVGAASDANHNGHAKLVRAIEGDIIPRLVLAQRAATGQSAGFRPRPPDLDDSHVEQLAELLLRQDASVALAYVDSIRAQGTSLGAIYLDLLAPAARRLGEMWCEDRCTFFEVTLGLCALHQLLRGLAPGAVRGTSDGAPERRILLVPSPGEQHTFGLIMVAEFFRRAGWEVWFETPQTTADLSRLVRGEWFAVVGMSVGCETPLNSVAPAILAARRASCNRALGVMVGGALINARPELVSLMGADATARDGRRAVAQAEGVVRLLSAQA